SVDELAFVDSSELDSIEGFDADTAVEIQTRARAFLARIEAEQDDRRKQLGVADALRDIDGVTTAMLVKFGENGVKSVEDLAGCATDDLVGWSERKDGETIKHPGFLEGLELSRADAEAMIMAARVAVGWVDMPVLAEPEHQPGEA